MSSEIHKDLSNPEYYHNRELSWLDFNYRVLSEARDPANPLLEQLQFLSIGSSNLDEFFMVRVAGLQDQVKMNVRQPENKTQMTPDKQLNAISEKNRQIVNFQYGIYNDLVKKLSALQIHFKRMVDLNPTELKEAETYFNEQIFPALTPLGIDAYRPFPNLNNKLINLFVNLEKNGTPQVAIVPLPVLIDRFITFKNGTEQVFLYTEDIIGHFIGKLFKGYTVKNTFYFRITRNADLELHEEGADDLLTIIEDYLKKRKNGMAVRLEVDMSDVHPEIQRDIEYLMKEMELQEREVYQIEGPLDLTVLSKISAVLSKEFPDLMYPTFKNVYPTELKGNSVFEVADKQDIFLHHPYDSFDPVVELLQEAANDPYTLAIKQTLYRVSSKSPVVQALKAAAENGKQVTVLVELKARFDEENNVHWAKELEEAGCHVLYGMTQLKTHSKVTLLVKKEKNQIKRYVHLGTGNYNEKTANIYTDMGIITTNKGIGKDVTDFFNYLSGYSEQPEYEHLYVSPFDIRDSFIEDIEEEIQLHKKSGNGHIIAKMNSLTDKSIIKKLYEASQAGVKIDLIIRGICCLRPQVPGISDNIKVRSIVGRFLEHSRIYYFYHNGQEKLYLSSADMMTRNMIKRVEIEFPVLDSAIQQEIMDILQLMLQDNAKAHEQRADGNYYRLKPEDTATAVNSQQMLMEKATAERRTQQANTSRTNWIRYLQKKLKLLLLGFT